MAKQKKVLVLRTCSYRMTSRNNFKWPEKGPVKAPDWNPAIVCGEGLHGLLWGEGDGYLLGKSSNAKWLVVEVLEKDIVDLGGKVKFPKGNVVYCGDQKGATDYMLKHAPGRAVTGATVVAGHSGCAVTGYRGTSVARFCGVAVAGDCGTATTNDSGVAVAGIKGKADAGYRGVAVSKDSGESIAGDKGFAISVGGNKAVAGERGFASTGSFGTSVAGDYGVASTGEHGFARAGVGGVLIFQTFVNGGGVGVKSFNIGENGVEPNVLYQCPSGVLVKAEMQEV